MVKVDTQKILSDLTVYTKYASYLPDKYRRQTWEEIVDENKKMMVNRYPDLEEEIEDAYKFVYDKKILPSMRGLQFGGLPIEINNARIFNCSMISVTEQFVFSEILFLLLSGTGVGFSIQRRHIEKIPKIVKPNGTIRYLIGDSIEGWADAVRALFNAYIKGKALPVFDYRDIRPKGSLIKKSGGIAPGPDSLKKSLENIKNILDYVSKQNRGLKPIEVHDIVCFIADCVVAGGTREAALISLFDFSEYEMVKCKSMYDCQIVDIIEEIKTEYGTNYKIKINSDIQIYSDDKIIEVDQWTYDSILETKKIGWWVLHPQRARANNSAIALRNSITKDQFDIFWKMVEDSGAGEPGIYWTNDLEYGSNPCCEIALRGSGQFCNLTTINASSVFTQEDLEERAIKATFIGTLQAGFTNFHYLRPQWKVNTDEEALLGVSMTGIVEGGVMNLDLKTCVEKIQVENRRVAKLIGVNPTARLTTIKPEGSSSLVSYCTASGIHPSYAPYYIRRMRIRKDLAVWEHLKQTLPSVFLEDDVFNPNGKGIVSIPVKAPQSSKFANTESSDELLERINFFHENWIKPGHNYGPNTHNVSATIYVKKGGWESVGKWMWERRFDYNGLSVLGYDDNTYQQAPFEPISEEKYNELINLLEGINFDLSAIYENTDKTELSSERSCTGINGCQIV